MKEGDYFLCDNEEGRCVAQLCEKISLEKWRVKLILDEDMDKPGELFEVNIDDFYLEITPTTIIKKYESLEQMVTEFIGVFF